VYKNNDPFVITFDRS